MTFSPQSLVHVYFHGRGKKESMGRLFLKNRQIMFEYDIDFLSSGLTLSPFKLPLTRDIIPSEDRTFDGLFGVFNDSLPDGWGRLLLDRKLAQTGIHALSALDRLCFVGSHGMGALSYEPENQHPSSVMSHDLDEIAREIHCVEAEDDRYLDELIALGGSSAGARPKVLLRIDNVDWLIKFRSSIDPAEIARTEYAYHLMAKAAGLNVSDAALFPSKKGAGFFGVKRFDRIGDQRIHMHTVSGLLHADHREPSLDYETIMRATAYLTRDHRECETQFRNAVFNVLSHNRDDHAKNFSFLMNAEGIWRVSPAYDLTFSSGPAGEHATMVMGEGKRPTRQHLLRLAEIGDIPPTTALEIIDHVQSAIQMWTRFADEAGVSKRASTQIAAVFTRK